MKTAVFTVLHPGSVQFVKGWYDSVMAQQDQDFDLHVALDDVPAPSFMDKAQFIYVRRGDTPAQIRWRAIMRLIHSHEAILFIDSDDEMLGGLIGEAKRGLETHDIYICSLRCVSSTGEPLNLTLDMPGEDLRNTVTEQNFLGFGNSSFRTSVLGWLWPAPSKVEPLDWTLAVWALDRQLSVYQDKTARIKYRLGGLGFPTSLNEEVILRGAQVVKHCWDQIAHRMWVWGTRVGFESVVIRTARKYTRFLEMITVPANLSLYTAAVAACEPQQCGWWWHIAYKPALEDLGWNLQ